MIAELAQAVKDNLELVEDCSRPSAQAGVAGERQLISRSTSAG